MAFNGSLIGGIAMIELKNVSKFFGSEKAKKHEVAIDNVSAIFKCGEVSTICGPDASGKTTLLEMIAGLEKPTNGEIFYEGRSSKDFTPNQLADLRAKDIAFVSSNPQLIDHMNVAENVVSGLIFKREHVSNMAKIAKYWLEAVGLKGCEKYQVKDLTLHQQQLVSLARALAKDAKIILADEPTACSKGKQTAEIVKILKEVSKNKTVIVTTHSKDIADSFDGAKFVLEEGKLRQTNETTTSIVSSATANKNTTLSRIGYVKGASFAFANMRKHKFRTCLTVLAMSLGVIGICSVLSLATGLDAYIDHIEETTLSTTPITVIKYKWSTEGTKSSQTQEQITAAETQDKETKRAQYLKDAANNRRIALNNTIGSLLSSNGNQNTDGASLLNDVPSLKAYLDTNPDSINDVTSSIEYTYDTSPVIYSTANNTIKEVYPGGMFGSLGTGSSSTKGSKASMTSSADSVFNYLNDFKVLPGSTEIYKDDDSLVEGKWAENADEAILVLNSDGTMDDSLAYTLGLRNFSSEIEPLIEKYKNGEKVDYPGTYDSWAYSDMIGITFKVINPSDAYQKQSDGTWEDKSSDDDFMNNLVSNNARDLKIVGVVKPADGSKAGVTLNTGIYYTPSLNSETMEAAKNSQIVQDQLSNPEVDVLTGKTFSWLKQASNITERVDFSNMVNFNADALASCVTLHPEVLDMEEKAEEIQEEVKLTDEQIEKLTLELLSDKDFQQFISDMSSSPKFDSDVQTVLAQAGAAYAQYYAQTVLEGNTPQKASEWFSKNGDGYTYTLYAQTLLPESLDEDISKFIGKYAEKVSNYIASTVETEISNMLSDLQKELAQEEEDSGPSLIEFDEQKFSEALKINITEDEITQLGYYLCGDTSHTYASNLSDFGYATTDTPITCTIYPKTFSDKEKIKAVLDKYNNQKRAEDKESQAISYSDTIGSVTSLIDNAIKIVSGFLIAVIAYSLISVVVLIAIICAISTFQRAREVGILKALGATKRDIFILFDSEAMLFGFLASIFSVIVTAIICYAVNSATMNSSIAFNLAQMTPQIVVGAIVMTTVVSALAGIIPSVFGSNRE